MSSVVRLSFWWTNLILIFLTLELCAFFIILLKSSVSSLAIFKFPVKDDNKCYIFYSLKIDGLVFFKTSSVLNFSFRRDPYTFSSSAIICLSDWIRYMPFSYEYFTSSWECLHNCLRHHCCCLPVTTLLLIFLWSLLIHLSIWLSLLKVLYEILLAVMPV